MISYFSFRLGCGALRVLVHVQLVAESVWRLTVEDEGPGLTEEQREKVFERFVRFNPSAADDSGSGLGLAICRSIVNLHRGRIFAAARGNGHGLRMVVEIPATRS